MYMRVCVCICMYKHVRVGICRYLIFVLSCAWKVMHMQCWVLLRRNRLSKRDANHSKTALTVLGLEHPPSGALLALCTTEPGRLTTLSKWWSIYHMSPGIYLHIPTGTYIYLHIHAYTYIYILIHAYTYIYMHIHAQLVSTRTPKICFWFRRARVRLAQCRW